MSAADEETRSDVEALWAVLDEVTAALNHAFWAMVWIGLIAVAAFVLAVWK